MYSIFEKKFNFIQYFSKVLASITIVAIPFLIWDYLFTKQGVWGFDADYHLPYKFLEMPIEEWLFFFCIPYTCLFTHEVLNYYFPKLKFTVKTTKIFSWSLFFLVLFLLIFYFGRKYSTVNFSVFIVLILYSVKYEINTLRTFLPSFLIILLPFFGVNGILTGSFIEKPIVWYNDNENIGIRIFTIPFEDVFYSFILLFMVVLVFTKLKKTKIISSL